MHKYLRAKSVYIVMGKFANHGVEYHIVYKTGEREVVAPMKDTDKRLLASKYYLEGDNGKHIETWLKPETMYANGPFVKPMDDPEFDVELTEEEKVRLEVILKDKGEDVAEHGWYEVNTIESTCYMTARTLYLPVGPSPPILKGFEVQSPPKEVKIKDKDYMVVAYRYDMYGQFTYVYVDEDDGSLKVVVWQDNHESAVPFHFDLVCERADKS